MAKLRVVSYNVHRWRDDRTALAHTVRELAPDVVVVQEAPGRFWRWRRACAELAHACGIVVAAGGQPAAGNLILTDLRVKVVRTWWVRFPLTPGRHLRGAAFARCEVAGVPFLVVGAHLSTDPSERPDQVRLLTRVLAGADAPVILGADVNDDPDSDAWKTLLASLRDAAVTGADAAGTDAARPTFPSRDPRRRIDAVFVDPAIAVEAYRVPDGPAVRRASDHLPVVADLRLPVPGRAGGQGRPGEE
jgi:endonuclease/exonuclease/phosphatase family metal-dependent hydrolase